MSETVGTTITTVQSAKAANRILGEIASIGNYKATNTQGEFVVYTRTVSGHQEVLTVKKNDDKQFEIVIQKEVVVST